MMETDKIQQLPLTLIDSSSNTVRELDEGSVAELCESIKALGVLQPVLVRPKGERYEIVFGNHRFHAAAKAGLSEIPCRVASLSDSEALLLSVTENIQRLEMNPIREGEVYAKLLQEFACAILATRLGKSQGYINNRVLLFSKLDPELRVEIGQRLTLGQAVALSKLPFSDQKIVFQRIQGIRAEMVNRAVLSQCSSPSPRPVDCEELRIAEEKARERMETCFECGGSMREEQSYPIDGHLYCVKCAPFVKRSKVEPIEEVLDRSPRHRADKSPKIFDASELEVFLCPKCGEPLKHGENAVLECANADCSVIAVKFLFIRYDGSEANPIAVRA